MTEELLPDLTGERENMLREYMKIELPIGSLKWTSFMRELFAEIDRLRSEIDDIESAAEDHRFD